MEISCDIIVVGAGLVGASLVASLCAEAHQSQKLRIIWLDRQWPQSSSNKATGAAALKNANSFRPISLNYWTVHWLKHCGLESALLPFYSPIQAVHVSIAGTFGQTYFTHQQLNKPFLGQVIAYDHLLQALHNANGDHCEIIRQSVTEISAITQDKYGLTLRCFLNNEKDETVIHAQYLLAADGQNSRIRELLKISYQSSNLQQIAVSGLVEAANIIPGLAYERFTPLGTLALLPHSKTQYAVVWTLPDASYPKFMQQSAVQQAEKIGKSMGGRLGRMAGFEMTGHFPLSQGLASTQGHGRCILLGDAAHRLPPLLAQGFNLSIQDVAVVTQLINRRRAFKNNFATSLYEQYIDLRAAPQQRIVAWSRFCHEAMHQTQSHWQEGCGMRALQGLGLSHLDHCQISQQGLANVAMGVQA